MEELKKDFGSLKDHVHQYIDTYKQLTVVKITKGASSAVSGAVTGIVAFLFSFFFLLFVFIGLAWWIGTAINSVAGGFFIVAGFFLLLLVILFATRKKLIVPAIRKMIISKMYE